MRLGDFQYLLPELSLLGSALALLLLGMVLTEIWVRRLSFLSMGVVAGLSWVTLMRYEVPVLLFEGLIAHTGYTCLAKAIVSSIAFGVFSLFLFSERSYRYEFSIIMLFATLGALTLVEANNLLSFYISFELQGLSSCILVCFNRDSQKSSEAAVKFFILGALSSCTMLYGISLIYGYTSRLDLGVLFEVFGGGAPLGNILGCALLFIGVLFKLAAVPFHMWSPDTYQGAPTPAVAFFIIVLKSALILLLAGVMMHVEVPTWSFRLSLMCVAALSVVVGELGALQQNDLKRFLAYSNIGHLGYVLPAIASGESAVSLVQYVLIYGVINTLIFSVLLRYGDGGVKLSSLRGIAGSSPFIAFVLTAAVISAAGLPPFPGFFAKYALLKAIVISGNFEIMTLIYVLFVCLMSVVPCFYAFRIAKTVYFYQSEAEYSSVAVANLGLSVIAFVAFLLSVLIFLFSGYFGDFAHTSSKIVNLVTS